MGGRWHRSWGGFTTILAERKHVTGRAYTKRWQRKLGENGVRLLERELMGLIDPDTMFPNEARWRAIDYLRRRLPEILHYKFERASMAGATWVMQGAVPLKNAVLYIDGGRVCRKYGQETLV